MWTICQRLDSREREKKNYAGFLLCWKNCFAVFFTAATSFFWHSNARCAVKRVFDILRFCYCCLSALHFDSVICSSVNNLVVCGVMGMMAVLPIPLLLVLLQLSQSSSFLFIFFSLSGWFVVCLNGCFNAVISCFITDKILHLTLTNNMPLRCRCSSLHNRPQNWTAQNKS